MVLFIPAQCPQLQSEARWPLGVIMMSWWVPLCQNYTLNNNIDHITYYTLHITCYITHYTLTPALHWMYITWIVVPRAFKCLLMAPSLRYSPHPAPPGKCWILYYSCLMYHLYRKSLSLMSLHYFSPFLKHQNLETVHTDLTWKVIPSPAQVSPGTHNTIQYNTKHCMHVCVTE